jgi:predicted aldo/keto reductase-like oxidoreductase
VLVTKCGRYGPDRFDFSGEGVAASTDMDDILVPVVEKYRIGPVSGSPLHLGIVMEQGRDRGSSVSERALRFYLDHPPVSGTMVGMATRHQVEANLRLLQAITDPELLNEVRILLSPVINRSWPPGRQENQDGTH